MPSWMPAQSLLQRAGRGLVMGLMLIMLAAGAAAQSAVTPARTTFRVDDGGERRRVELERLADGRLVYRVEGEAGQSLALSPEEFAAWTLAPREDRRWIARLFNISSAAGFAWVALGMLGQALFTGRMLVQWLASEREKRSIIPTSFWWMSLGGSIMLVAYFLWRRDVVGVLGQSTGCFIYVRNLRLIYRKQE